MFSFELRQPHSQALTTRLHIYFPKPIKDVLATKAKWGRKIKMNDFLKMFQWKFNLLVGNFKFKSGRFKWPNCLFYSIFPTLPISFCFLSTQKMLRTSNFVQVSALILNVQSFNIRFDPVFCSKHRELFMMGIIWSLSHSKRQMSPSLDNWISFFFSIYKMQRLNCSLQSILVLTFYKSVNQLTKYRAGDICRCSWLKAFLAKSYSYSEPTVHMLMKYNQLYIFCVAGKKQQRRWFKNHLLLASEYLYIEIYSF